MLRFIESEKNWLRDSTTTFMPCLPICERGKPDFQKAVPAKPGDRTDTKLWAAFVLSGVGR